MLPHFLAHSAHLPWAGEAGNMLLYHVLYNVSNQTTVVGGTGHSKKVTGHRKANMCQDEETCISKSLRYFCSSMTADQVQMDCPEVQAA